MFSRGNTTRKMGCPYVSWCIVWFGATPEGCCLSSSLLEEWRKSWEYCCVVLMETVRSETHPIPSSLLGGLLEIAVGATLLTASQSVQTLLPLVQR